MKKIKRLLRRHKRLLAQCALFTPLAFFSGINFLTPLLLIFGALTLYGLRALYGNDPYVKKNGNIESKPLKTHVNPLDPLNIYLGFSTPSNRKKHLGF